jgi:hypothetical protein
MPGYRCRGKGPPTRPTSPGRRKEWPPPKRRKKWATWCLKDGGESNDKIRAYIHVIIQGFSGQLTMEEEGVVDVADVLATLQEKCNVETGFFDPYRSELVGMLYEAASSLDIDIVLCLRRRSPATRPPP